MSIRIAVSHVAAGLVACLAVAASGEALAQANVLKECGSQYQKAKADNALNGQGWQDFLKACRTRIEPAKADPAKGAEPVKAAEPAKAPEPVKAAEPAKPAEPVKAAEPAPAANPLKPAAAAPAATAPAAAKPASEGRVAAQSRQKKCGAEWKAQKADLRKSDPKITWPKYWSACNTRLKAAGE
jgi:hypothetical protein